MRHAARLIFFPFAAFLYLPFAHKKTLGQNSSSNKSTAKSVSVRFKFSIIALLRSIRFQSIETHRIRPLIATPLSRPPYCIPPSSSINSIAINRNPPHPSAHRDTIVEAAVFHTAVVEHPFDSNQSQLTASVRSSRRHCRDRRITYRRRPIDIAAYK